MTKYINTNAFLEYEENRCKKYPPLIGTCSFDNADLKEELANFPAADVEHTKRNGTSRNARGACDLSYVPCDNVKQKIPFWQRQAERSV